MKLITVITANYNKADFISEMINSVINQSYQNWELIIIDDCSKDNSVNIIKEYCKNDIRVNLLENDVNKGGNFSRNRGLKAANGDFIIFMDSDDLFTENCFQNRIEVANVNENFDLWVFPMGVFKKKIGDCSEEMYWKVEGTDFLDSFLKHKLPWQTCQPLWKKDTVNSLNGFDEQFIRLQDVELHTRMLLENKQVYVGNSHFYNCYFRIDEDRIEVNQFKFLSNFTKGASQYYTKFYPLLVENKRKLIVGTLIEVLSNICHQRRKKTINKLEFELLTSQLIETCQNAKQKTILKIYVFLESKMPFNPKGLKKIVTILS